MPLRVALFLGAVAAACGPGRPPPVFPIETCPQAAAAVQGECGYASTEGTACWDAEGVDQLVGLAAIIDEELFDCMRGALDCGRVRACMRDAGYEAPESSREGEARP